MSQQATTMTVARVAAAPIAPSGIRLQNSMRYAPTPRIAASSYTFTRFETALAIPPDSYSS